jgi:hypothetical protein
MLSLNGLVWTVIVMFMLASPTVLRAAVLELGESELHGKKDQPEAMTLVSRAPLEVSESQSDWRPVSKIRQEVSRDIFKVALTD